MAEPDPNPETHGGDEAVEAHAATGLSWGLLICTYNRATVLAEAMRLVLAQSRPPREIIIIDASPDWEASRDTVATLMAGRDIALHYQAATERSSATQRNQAIALASTDVVFLLDDDSFLFADSAAEIMDVYEADTGDLLAGVGLSPSTQNPASTAIDAPRKRTGNDIFGGMKQLTLLRRPVRWFYRKVLMMHHEEGFLAYATPEFPVAEVPAPLRHLRLRAVNDISGFAMTVRRSVAKREPFDTALRYYAAMEDADVSHRFLRHGALVLAGRARVHHFRTGASRLPRDKVIILQLLNLAVFLKRHSPILPFKERQYTQMLRRRLLAEFLKDVLSLRLTLPQVRGVWHVMNMRRAIFAMPAETLVTWYPDFQRRLIEEDDYATRLLTVT